MKKYTEDQVRDLLRAAADTAGSQRKLAKSIGCSAPFVTDVLKGRRAPSGPVLKYLGLERVEQRQVVYAKGTAK